MFLLIPIFIRLPVIAFLVVLNTLTNVSMLLLSALLKACAPIPAMRAYFNRSVIYFADAWIAWNSWLMRQCTDLKIEQTVHSPLQMNGHYLVISNHQSWVDILVLQAVLNKRIPFMRFFLKQELIWVPMLGLAWWALDFPFMRRYSKSHIQKNPALAGKDIEITRKACEKFIGQPVSIMIFPEGTRFTSAKHVNQQSPFANLLKPKSGGIAYALNAMGEGLQQVVNVTLHYPNGKPSVLDLMASRVHCVYVDICVQEIPEHIRMGNYQSDRAFRASFQTWLNGIWQDKQNLLEKLAKQ